FEGGHFAEAQFWWCLLTPPASAGPDRPAGITFPDAGIEVIARVRAKQIVTLLFQESGDRIEAELKAYRLRHAKAAGSLAGRTGNYADLIYDLWQPGQGTLPASDQEWPTFAGAFSRQRPLPAVLSARTWADGPVWRVRLDSGALVPASVAAKPANGKPSPRRLAFQPVLAGNVVHVADSRFGHA